MFPRNPHIGEGRLEINEPVKAPKSVTITIKAPGLKFAIDDAISKSIGEMLKRSRELLNRREGISFPMAARIPSETHKAVREMVQRVHEPCRMDLSDSGCHLHRHQAWSPAEVERKQQAYEKSRRPSFGYIPSKQEHEDALDWYDRLLSGDPE